MGLRRGCGVVGFVALLGVVVWAEMPATPKALPVVPAGAVEIQTFLPSPAGPESAEGKAELDLVKRTQQAATEGERARAKSEMKLGMGAFTSVMGTWFTAENLPKTAALFKQLEKDSKLYTTAGKNYFKRVRPCDTEGAGITDITGENDQEYSYPSGHSTRGTIYAMVLAELMPELKEKLLLRAQEIGWDRIIAGVHFPSDIVAGRILGGALARGTLANPAMKGQLEEVRAELAAAKGKKLEASSQKPVARSQKPEARRGGVESSSR